MRPRSRAGGDPVKARRRETAARQCAEGRAKMLASDRVPPLLRSGIKPTTDFALMKGSVESVGYIAARLPKKPTRSPSGPRRFDL